MATTSTADGGVSEQERNKHLVRDLVQEVYSGDLAKLDGLVSGDFVDHSRSRDREGLRSMLAQLKSVFAYRRFIVEDIFAEKDRVALRIRGELGRNADPGDNDRTVHATAIFRISDGRIAEHWGHSDAFL